MKKNVMALSIAAMIGGLGFAGAVSAAVITGGGAKPAPTYVDIAAGVMAPATAATLTVNPSGSGNALVVPYFNTQNGNMTVLHVVNTDQANGKVAKVRFRSASNSDDILDFQVFLSPGDVWTAAVLADADGLSQLVTADNTCTVPAIAKNTPVPFDKSRLPTFGKFADEAERNNLTREGYVEIFNMADITNAKAWDSNGFIPAADPGAAGQFSPLYKATKHSAKVAPCSVAGSAARAQLDGWAVADHTEATATAIGMNTPTGGLIGDWYIMNVAQTTTFSGTATALALNGRGNFTHFPQLGTAAVPAADTVTADPLFRSNNVNDAAGVIYAGPALTLLNFDVPDMSTPMFGADPLAQAANLLTQLSVLSVTNQYANDASVSGKTDWVFSMPARRYNVAANYAAVTGTSGAAGATSANAKYRLFTDLTGNAVAAEQTGNWFFPAVETPATGGTVVGAGNPDPILGGGALLTPKVSGNTSVDAANGNICVLANGQKFYDREETTGSAVPVFSPGTSTSLEFCGEVSVASFQDAGVSVLDAKVARRNISAGSYTSGWAALNTLNYGMGLPLVGSSYIKLTNPEAAPGTVGTYGITWDHRYTKLP